MNSSSEKCILAIDPIYRGLGWAVIEGGTRLVDWGVRNARQGNKNSVSLRRVAELIGRYEPDVVVVENCKAAGSRRCRRVERLIERIEGLASKKDIEVCKVSRAMLEEAFFHAEASTKHEIATVIARRFPALAVWVPPLRRTWMAEDYRDGMFDAVALGLTYFYLEEEERRAA
ncbi:MAG: hypothetical protein HY294_06525 [Candidatus Rokubacteria bacterium]|nr:hypothetical protein [Candidatus Rokubacteria bacterium]